MKISVCIPVYNGEAYIAETIRSVLNQSCKEYELLVVDNHSTDHTLEEVGRFSDPRIRLIKNDKNYGMFENWNICLREAKGDYIQILCADDFIDPGCLAGKARILEKYQDVVLVFSASNVVDAEGKTVLKRRPFHNNKICDGRKMAKRSFRTGNIYGEPSNVMFRRTASKKTGEFSGHLFYSLDWEYWLRLSLQGKAAYIDKCYSNFRISGASTTGSILKQGRELKKAMEKDDRLFVQKVKQKFGASITGTDILMHYIAVNARFLAKIVFIKAINKRQGDVV